MNDHSTENDRSGKVVNDVREAVCPVCDRSLVSRRLRDLT